MKKEIRTICYDEDLKLESYRLEGIVQPFPNHFHEYYVIGFIEEGERRLSCKNKEYILHKNDIVLFNPGDNHSCYQTDGRTLDYRGINISKESMLNLTKEITHNAFFPCFSKNVLHDEELTGYLRPLHQMIMDGSNEFEKEENLLLMISLLLDRYSQPFEDCTLQCQKELDDTCEFIRQHFAEPIDLEQLCKCSGLSKSSLLRAFTKSKGVTPYRYLQTIRINEAKKLLEKGVPPMEVAIQTGFADQSHFTNFFTMFIGLAPGAYREIFINKKQEEQGGKSNGE